MTNIKLSVDAAQEILTQMKGNRKRKDEYIQSNYLKWNDEGMVYRQKRKELGLSLRDISERLGTSTTRIRNFEVGEPVSQAEHLKASYNLLFDYIELQSFVIEFKDNVSRSTDILFDNMLTTYKKRIK